MNGNKKILALAVLCAVASVGFVLPASAEETMQHDLDEVIVEADRDALPGGFVKTKGSLGILGDKSILDVPFSQTNISAKTLELFGGPTQPLDNVLVGVPAIRQAGSVLHNDFTIRGFRANGTSMYVNGVHGMLTQFNVPMAAFERIDVTAGPNTGISGSGVQYESSTAGGIINLISKKAGEQPLFRYRQTFSGKGSFGEYLDLSSRFGKDKSWGLRINTELLNGETSVDKTDIKAKGIYMNLDHRDTKSTTNFLAGYRDIDIKNGMRWFKIGPNVKNFPSPIDGSKNYAFDGMEKGAYGYFMVLNHEQKLNDDWKVFFNGGLNNNKLNKNVMGQNSAFTIKDDAGNYDLNYQSSATPQKAYYTQIGTSGKFATGAVKHETTLAIDKAWRNRDASTPLGYTNFGQLGTGNIYTGEINQTGMPDGSYKTYLNNKTSIWGISFIDSLKYEKWGAVLGVHKHQGTSTSYSSATGKATSSVTSDATCPTYALTYNPNEKIMLYGSHSENFDLGAVAGSTYQNVGEILPPSKTKQSELGVKYLNKGLLTTLALFDIKQANNIAVTDPAGGKDFLLQDGEVKHRGIELSFNGAVASKWNVMAGIAYMDAKYEKTAKGVKDGVQESGQPKWSGSAALEYKADENFSIIGRALYTGSTPLYNTDSSRHFYAPSYVTFDLGVTYKTKLNNIPTKLSLMCYNLANKDYWMVSRGDQIYASTPRTIYMSAEFTI